MPCILLCHCQGTKSLWFTLISLHLASYESGSSAVPTPDASVDLNTRRMEDETVPAANTQFAPVAVPPKPAYSSSEDPFASPQAPKVTLVCFFF